MRVHPNQPLEDVEASLNKIQRKYLRELDVARDTEDARIREVRQDLRRRVKKAMESGVPVVLLSRHLDVSLARVYQMRDEVDAAPVAALTGSIPDPAPDQFEVVPESEPLPDTPAPSAPVPSPFLGA